MRKGLFIAAICGALWCVPANAQSTSEYYCCVKVPTMDFMTSFDSSSGTLNSVVMFGSVDFGQSIVRAYADTANAAEIPVADSTMLAGKTLQLTGYESFAAGSDLGDEELTWSGYLVFTGADAAQFASLTPGPIMISPDPLIGLPLTSGVFAPFDQISETFSFDVFYNYYPPGVPEPNTWAMILIGFAGIGLVLRRRVPQQRRYATAV